MQVYFDWNREDGVETKGYFTKKGVLSTFHSVIVNPAILMSESANPSMGTVIPHFLKEQMSISLSDDISSQPALTHLVKRIQHTLA